MAVDKNCVGTLLGGGAQRHGRMNSELARFVRRRGDHPTLVALSAYNHRLTFQTGIEKFFHGDEECVHVDMENGAGEGGLVGSSHVDKNSSSRVRLRFRTTSWQPSIQQGKYQPRLWVCACRMKHSQIFTYLHSRIPTRTRDLSSK